jgi:NitT/TauT family transport system permease protein
MSATWFSSTPAVAPRSMWLARAKALLTGRAGTALVVFTVLLSAWEAAVRIFNVPSFILPAPTRIVHDTANVGWALLGHAEATLITVIGGYFCAILISFPLAAAISSSSRLSNAIYPLLVVKQSIPVVALAPILTILFGTGAAARIAITTLIALFPMVVATATGLSSTSVEMVELSRSMDATWRRRLFDIRLPNAVPHIFSGLKVSMTLALIGAVVSEFVAAEQGLGFLIYTSTAFFQLPTAFGAMIILGFIGTILFQGVSEIERRLFPWAVGLSDSDM